MLFNSWLDSVLKMLDDEGFHLIDFEITNDEWREKFHRGDNATLVVSELLESIDWYNKEE